MKINTEVDMLHPVLIQVVQRIQSKVINKHNMPFRLFETGRAHARHSQLIKTGKTRDIVSQHLYDITNDPPLYATAVDYVYFDNRWSWNIRDSSVRQWYQLFGQLVLDIAPELNWGGLDRKSTNYNHFQLRRGTILEYIDIHPCVMP